MEDEKNTKQAQAAFRTLCEMLDERGWHYEKNPEELFISCSAQGDDLPMEIRICVDAERQLILLLSHMPFNIPEDKRTALAIAVSAANNGMIDGSFDYDYQDGNIFFRMTSSFRDSLVGKEAFEYMLYCSCYTIDRYNDKFLMVAKSNMSNEEILNFID